MSDHENPSEAQHYSQASAAFLHQRVTELTAENEQLERDVAYWQQQTNHWYMRANYSPAEIAEFRRRASMGIDENGEWILPGARPGSEQTSDTNTAIDTNSSINYNGTTERPEEAPVPTPRRRASRPARSKGTAMSYIVRTGNLAKTPKLYEGESGPYTYARILVTDSESDGNGSWTEGPTIAYEVNVSGAQARELVATAERSGNVRVMFSGRYRVTEDKNERGTFIRHEVRADQVGISLRGQSVTVDASKTAPAEAFGDDTPF